MPEYEIGIIHEEASFLVINKPSGLLTQAVPGVESVQSRLYKQLAVRAGATSNPFVGLPHRLDRGTSGALLIARNERALKRFGGQFQSAKVKKVYIALLECAPTENSARWIDAMRKIPDQPQAELVEANDPDARQAILHYQTVSNGEYGCLVRIELETGRMHQIRLQFASRGFPLVGDRLYGSPRSWGPTEADRFHEQFALHAWQLGFHHPITAKFLKVQAPFPSTWNNLPTDQLVI